MLPLIPIILASSAVAAGTQIADYKSSRPGVNGFTCLFKHKVKPSIGSVMMVKLALVCEHTGIYLGDDKIAEVNSEGRIIAASFDKFTEGASIGYMIYCAVDQYDNPICDKEWAERASSNLNKEINYKLFKLNKNKNEANCHNFVISCITGNFDENTCCFFNQLDATLKSKGMDHWQPAWHKLF